MSRLYILIDSFKKIFYYYFKITNINYLFCIYEKNKPKYTFSIYFLSLLT